MANGSSFNIPSDWDCRDMGHEAPEREASPQPPKILHGGVGGTFYVCTNCNVMTADGSKPCRVCGYHTFQSYRAVPEAAPRRPLEPYTTLELDELSLSWMRRGIEDSELRRLLATARRAALRADAAMSTLAEFTHLVDRLIDEAMHAGSGQSDLGESFREEVLDAYRAALRAAIDAAIAGSETAGRDAASACIAGVPAGQKCNVKNCPIHDGGNA